MVRASLATALSLNFNANSAQQAEDFYTFLVTTRQTMADVHFCIPPLTSGSYFLKMGGSQVNIYIGTCEATRFDSISNQTSDSGFDS